MSSSPGSERCRDINGLPSLLILSPNTSGERLLRCLLLLRCQLVQSILII